MLNKLFQLCKNQKKYMYFDKLL